MVMVILLSRAFSSVSTLLAMIRPIPDFLTLRSAWSRALSSAEDLNIGVWVSGRFFKHRCSFAFVQGRTNRLPDCGRAHDNHTRTCFYATLSQIDRPSSSTLATVQFFMNAASKISPQGRYASF